MSIKSIISIVPNNQKWVCLSFLSDKDICLTTGIRVGGVFDTYEDACEQAKKINEIDNYNHVFVGQMGDWLPFNPDANDSSKVKDSTYQNEDLNKLMKGRIESQSKADKLHELRKTSEMITNIETNIKTKEKNKEELNKKLKKAKNTQEMTSLTNTLDSVNEQIKKMEERLKECKVNENNLGKEL